jgi:predicted HTH transcriptional regulator
VSYTEIKKNLSIGKTILSEYINNLKRLGYIERVGSERTGCWKVK